MAIWQYSLFIVPKVADDVSRNLLQRFADEMKSEDYDNDSDTLNWWDGYPKRDEFLDSIRSVLPQYRSWSTDIEFFGVEDGNCLSVVYEKDRTDLCEVFARLDLRSNYVPYLMELVRIAREFNLAFISEDVMMLEPEYDAIEEVVNSSANASFVRDPISFIERLQNNTHIP